MFSSLEALDADDNLHAAPVPRQGAFQPKAKPRARKAGAGPARTPSSVPASKAKSLPSSASNPLDKSEQQNDVTRLQEAVETAVERNLESQSVGITPEVSNQVGIETGPTHNSGLADASLINSADFTAEPDSNLNIHAPSESQATSALHEPRVFDEASGNPVSAILEFQESVVVPSQVLSEQDAIGCLSILSEEKQSEALTLVSDAPSAFDELLASHTFVPSQVLSEQDAIGCLSILSEEKHSEALTLVSDAPSAFDELLASHTFVPVVAEVEHVTEVGAPYSIEDLPSSSLLETTGASRKKKKPRKDRQDDLLVVVDQGGLVLAKDAPIHDSGTTSNSEAKPLKKKKKRTLDDANEQQERVSVEPTSNTQKKTKRAKAASFAASVPAGDAYSEETMQEEVAKRAAESVKKKKKRHNPAQDGRDDGKDNTIGEASSKKKKKTSFTCASDSAAEPAVEVNGAKGIAQEAVSITVMKQEVGDVHTLLDASKRKRRKPAKFLDGADDELVNVIIKGNSELAMENGRQESQIGGQQDFEENDLLAELFPSLPKKISKLKESKFASFNATADATASQPSREGGRKATAAEEKEKKKFKKFVRQRRRVDRRAMNPADPDLDPKKMTMKDIIRLAEAKERMLKKDNAKKAKNGDQVTVNEPEREPESHESTCLAPQVQIVDGQIVINEHSLVINAHPKADIRTYKRVEETHAKLNYHSYMKRTRTQTWRPDETERFYQALREFGTNFGMIQHLFPGRTRKQVFLKYKKEERCSPLRISEAMRVKPCDTSHFLEVMSSLNLLPSDIPDELESGQASVPMEFSSKMEIGENSCSPGVSERQRVDAAECAHKLDEQSVDSMNQEAHDGSSNSPCNIEAFSSGQPSGNQELMSEEATKPNEIAKPSLKALLHATYGPFPWEDLSSCIFYTSPQRSAVDVSRMQNYSFPCIPWFPANDCRRHLVGSNDTGCILQCSVGIAEYEAGIWRRAILFRHGVEICFADLCRLLGYLPTLQEKNMGRKDPLWFEHLKAEVMNSWSGGSGGGDIKARNMELCSFLSKQLLVWIQTSRIWLDIQPLETPEGELQVVWEDVCAVARLHCHGCQSEPSFSLGGSS
ncbi:hypothetical protein GOP47_0021711 [Adiantum capillus-veneris]|uniref:Myb-like domain-containing protein n=1 Tax=Adiantum capillus-veneris TaxID=13818 RepID=A0A9D4U9R2_ADICA|nr:hypothetical protein GOP47_0021711 [Adiantum capillus-veneris]